MFAGSSPNTNGLTYMLGATGGYLVGYLLATLALGWRRGAAGTAASAAWRWP